MHVAVVAAKMLLYVHAAASRGAERAQHDAAYEVSCRNQLDSPVMLSILMVRIISHPPERNFRARYEKGG